VVTSSIEKLMKTTITKTEFERSINAIKLLLGIVTSSTGLGTVAILAELDDSMQHIHRIFEESIEQVLQAEVEEIYDEEAGRRPELVSSSNKMLVDGSSSADTPLDHINSPESLCSDG